MREPKGKTQPGKAPETESRKRLDSWLEKAGKGAAKDLAIKVGVSPSTITHWRYGAMRPKDSQRTLIELHTAGVVTAAGWRTTDERKAWAELARRAS
jgi:transcriptional regulator with XRE-family HTH domain